MYNAEFEVYFFLYIQCEWEHSPKLSYPINTEATQRVSHSSTRLLVFEAYLCKVQNPSRKKKGAAQKETTIVHHALPLLKVVNHDTAK